MGWLGKLFHKKKTIPEVDEWLQEQQQKQQHEYVQALQEFHRDFPELLQQARKALHDIETGELRNTNIPERAKHYMTGNREQLSRITRRFLDNLFIPKKAPDLSQLDVLFHDYAKNSSRAATILAEFFGEYIKQLRGSLADIEAKLHTLKTINARKDEFTQIQQLIERLSTIHQEREQTEKEANQLLAQHKQLTQKLETIKKEKQTLTEKQDYLQVKKDVVNAAKARQDAQETITALFQPLTEPLKKFAHKTKNEKLAAYAEHPLDALTQDYSLAILKHVDELIAALTKEELGVKPERAQKALDSLKQFDKEYLSKLIHTYATAKKREADIHHDVAQRPVMKEYEQYAQDIKKLTTDIEQLAQTIEKIELPTDTELREELVHVLEQYKIILVQ